MKKLVLIILALTGLPFIANAQEMTPPSQMPAGLYKLDPAHTSVTWKINHMGLSHYTGRFSHIQGTMTYDPAAPENAAVKVSIDPYSIRTDYPEPEKKDFDKELASGKEWFNAGEYPAITFESLKLERTDEKTGKLHGNLKMLGVTKPIVLDVTFNGAYAKMPIAETPAMGFSATGMIKRSSWGMGKYVPMVGDEVQVIIETEFHKTPQ